MPARAARGASVEALFEGRRAPVHAGAIADCFLPHQVHVYRLR